MDKTILVLLDLLISELDKTESLIEKDDLSVTQSNAISERLDELVEGLNLSISNPLCDPLETLGQVRGYLKGLRLEYKD